MAELKTKKNNASVETFLNSIENAKRKKDSFVAVDIIKKITISEPNM